MANELRRSHRTRRTVLSVSIALLLLFAGTTTAKMSENELIPHRATYKVKISVLSGEMLSRLDLVNGEYAVSSTINPKGLARLVASGSIQESSKFEIENGHVRPTNYDSSDSLSKNGGDVKMSFDWNANEITREVDKATSRSKLEPGAVDRASLQYALMFDLLNDRLRQEYVLLESDEDKKLVVTIKSKKSVTVPHGTYDVIGVTHSAASSSRETTLWCAPSLGFLPIVIEQFRDGKIRGRIVLTDYEAL